MSKKLAGLLARPEAEVTKVLSKLEELSGYPSEDVRLLAENKQKLRTKISQLGLDPDDTTDEELYYALRTRFDRDSRLIDRALGVSDSTDFAERLSKAVQLVAHCASVDEMWLVKNSVAKSALARTPPKQLIKKLRYRTVASLIKREDIGEIYLTAAVIESASWQRTVPKQLAKLNSSDYELRPVRIVQLPISRWGAIDGPESNIAVDGQLGVAAIWPSSDLKEASVLNLTLLLLEGLQAINSDAFSESLHELSPTLRWWADCDYLISDDSHPVSFNLHDVALNHLKNHDLEDGVSHHGGQSLWRELTNRYQKISDSLVDAIPDIDYNFSQTVPRQPRLPTDDEMATEYAAIE